MSVRPSVCLSVTSPFLSKRLIEASTFLAEAVLDLLCWKVIRVPPKIGGTSLWNFFPNSGRRKFRHCTSTVSHKCCQLRWTLAQCDKLATVVGHQFITLSVHLCVQHYGRNTAHRAGLSEAAETCIVRILHAAVGCSVVLTLTYHVS